MKKRVTMVLEVELDDELNMRDNFIRSDLEQEINCASNFYDIIDFKTEIAEDIARRLMEGMKSC